MAYTLDEFCKDLHDALVEKVDDESRETVRANLEKLLANPDFIAETWNEDTPPGKRVLYHDKDTDVYVLAHVQEAGKKGNPHSHGASWAIYGNATGATDMSVWRRTNSEDDDHAELVLDEEYSITPGKAQAYGPGVIHSTGHPGKAWVIRVTGTDLDTLPRYRFDPKKDKILETA
ncbi:MAG TPA: hypothetical protein VLN73_09505 [Alphaproteobacteria bacterium]|nr:hypothetical protein [Alphaproteobacteria bacterium]